MNQEQKILQHLRTVGDISGLEAADMYRVRDLPKRISVLRQQGVAINSVMKRDLVGGRYARYSLA